MSAIQAKTRYAVATLKELPVGSRKIVRIAAFGKEIGVFNVGGRLFAYRNGCPDAGAPVCQGKVCGTTASSAAGEYILAREGEILRCPWHGWEFDLIIGAHLVDEKMKLRGYDIQTGNESLESYPIEIEGKMVFVLI